MQRRRQPRTGKEAAEEGTAAVDEAATRAVSRCEAERLHCCLGENRNAATFTALYTYSWNFFCDKARALQPNPCIAKGRSHKTTLLARMEALTDRRAGAAGGNGGLCVLVDRPRASGAFSRARRLCSIGLTNVARFCFHIPSRLRLLGATGSD